MPRMVIYHLDMQAPRRAHANGLNGSQTVPLIDERVAGQNDRDFMRTLLCDKLLTVASQLKVFERSCLDVPAITTD